MRMVTEGKSHMNVQSPATWGDLLLLGTDAEVRIQDAAPDWPATNAVVPGHSHLVTIIDPDVKWTVDPAEFRSKSHNTPFAGWELKGRAVTVIVGGQVKLNRL